MLALVAVLVRGHSTVRSGSLGVAAEVQSHGTVRSVDVANPARPVKERLYESVEGLASPVYTHTQLSVQRTPDRKYYWAARTDDGADTNAYAQIVAIATAGKVYVPGVGKVGGYTKFCLQAVRGTQDFAAPGGRAVLEGLDATSCDWELTSSGMGVRWALADGSGTTLANVEYAANRASGAAGRSVTVRLHPAGDAAQEATSFHDVKPVYDQDKDIYEQPFYHDVKSWGLGWDIVERVAEPSVSNMVLTAADPEVRAQAAKEAKARLAEAKARRDEQRQLGHDAPDPERPPALVPLDGDLLQLGKASEDLYRLDLFRQGAPVSASKVQAFAVALSSLSWKLRVA